VQFRWRSIVVLSLAAFWIVAGSPPTWGNDHRPPRAKLHVNGQARQLSWWSGSWSWRTGPNECVTQVADGVPTFKPIAEVHVHSTPRIVFHKKQRPKGVFALADDHLRNGYLAHGKQLDVKIRPHDGGGRRVWVAKLPTTVHRRLFVDLEAHWRDRSACGGPRHASWAFGLRRP
jgi:hypothetical protein